MYWRLLFNEMEKGELKEKYLASKDHFILLMKKEEKLLFWLSVLRLVIFTGGFVLIWMLFTLGILTGIFSVITVAALFFFLLKLYSVHLDKRDYFMNMALLNQNEAAAVSGDISAFDAGNSYKDSTHDFSNDVDLFGNFSLFQYLNRTVTGYGRDILAGWLSYPYRLSDRIGSRQEAIQELALNEKWRHGFMASGMKKPIEKEHITALLEWTEETRSVRSSPIRKFLIFFLPFSAILTFILFVTGILSYSLFVFIFFLNLFYIATGLKKTNAIHNVLSKKYEFLASMEGLLRVFEKESFSSAVLNEIKSNISGNEISAEISVKKLGSLIQAFDSRLNILVAFMLNGLFLWDYHCIYRLERWKSEYRDLFPVWLDMLGQADAYISLANYANNNVGFAYPAFSEGNKLFYAKNLGHPLIDETKRVCNDFELERSGNVCIISGANMAGKSTFLRTIAVNYILGMCGAPVCAETMSFVPLKLFTSMRTTDSLSNNESYFYAELKRLKVLISRIEKGEPVLFILDEILKGTNSADKSLGSKLFMKRILEFGGTGLIATHDTSLGELEKDYPGLIFNRCFEIEIDGEVLSFDYKLQNGITHKMNAAFLMKQMGILG
jgi:hypothetical protein